MPEYIKREDVQNMLDVAQIITDADGEFFGYCTEDVDINAIPVADVRENVRGKWIYEKAADMFICSKCGDAMVRNTFFYCPWCGAQMRGNDNV